MLDKEIKQMMKRHNKLRSQADDLKSEIEKKLEENWSISADDRFFTENGRVEPFMWDSNCSIYDWGTELFDIKMIGKIVAFIEDYRKRNGEQPDLEEIYEHFAS